VAIRIATDSVHNLEPIYVQSFPICETYRVWFYRNTKELLHAAIRCSQFLHYKVKSFTLFLIKDQNHSVSSADFSDTSINDLSLPTRSGSFPSMPPMGIDLAGSVSHLGKTNIFQSIAAGSTHQVSELRALV
jgi:hypothetical protein